jgi:hypothetical protein
MSFTRTFSFGSVDTSFFIFLMALPTPLYLATLNCLPVSSSVSPRRHAASPPFVICSSHGAMLPHTVSLLASPAPHPARWVRRKASDPSARMCGWRVRQSEPCPGWAEPHSALVSRRRRASILAISPMST